MPDVSLEQQAYTARADWVRLRTLILLRWMAVAGQTAAVLVATLVLNLDLHFDLCALAIGASAVFNLVSTFVFPRTTRLTERQTTLTLLFDIGQLAILLYLTGGLGNPFAFLMLAPVTIAATALSLRPTILVMVSAIAIVTALDFHYVPLRSQSGAILEPPQLFVLGNWAALLIGIVFIGGYARRVALETFSVSQALLATQMALDREQKLAALGGVVAATAHELGTPLATIKLSAGELAGELGDRPDLREDAELIRVQADRCRDILRDMGRSGKDDLHLRTTTLQSLVEEAAEPHRKRGKALNFRVNGVSARVFQGRQPLVPNQPEIIHGLRNLVQNAVDFARSAVWIDAEFNEQSIRISIGDDGAGYPPELLGRIGEPFLRTRGRNQRKMKTRPGYEGMGLGLFIAKTLLERSGAELTFANGSESPLAAPGGSDDPAGPGRPPGAGGGAGGPGGPRAGPGPPDRRGGRGALAESTPRGARGAGARAARQQREQHRLRQN
ncbi:MAG: sensor histidine kinase RegB [Paracoccaceae bacterium]